MTNLKIKHFKSRKMIWAGLVARMEEERRGKKSIGSISKKT
jgi:hypothetical protein